MSCGEKQSPHSTKKLKKTQSLSLPLAIGCRHALVSADQTPSSRTLNLKEARIVAVSQAAGCQAVMVITASWEIVPDA